MGGYPAGSITKNNTEVPIFVDDQGLWKAEHGGRSLSADTRDKLESKIATATKRTTRAVTVPVTQVKYPGNGYDGGISYKRGVATGIHSSNGNVLMTWTVRGTEVKEQLTTHGYGTHFLGNVSEGELSEFNQLCIDLVKAQKAHRAFLRKHEINVKDVVVAALDSQD